MNADDIILCLRANKKTCTNLNKILKLYFDIVYFPKYGKYEKNYCQ